MPSIPARSFAAAPLKAGQSIKVANTNGSQVVDTWALSNSASSAFPGYMSMVHTRSTPHALLPSTQEVFLDNRRQPILTMVEDTSPGLHDIFFAACSPERYVQLGASPDHDNCANNLYNAVKTYNNPAYDKFLELMEFGWLPDPLNLFMNVIVKGNKLENQAPRSQPGDYVVLQADQDCVVFMSACPMDVTACNGGTPSSAEFQVI